MRQAASRTRHPDVNMRGVFARRGRMLRRTIYEAHRGIVSSSDGKGKRPKMRARVLPRPLHGVASTIGNMHTMRSLPVLHPDNGSDQKRNADDGEQAGGTQAGGSRCRTGGAS